MSSTAPGERDANNTLLQPGQIIRPQVNEQMAIQLVKDLYGLTVTYIKQHNSYDDKNFQIKVEPEYNNPYIEKLCPQGYMLKILNSMDTQKTHVCAEHEMQILLYKHGIQCPQPVLNIHGEDYSKEKIYRQENKDWVANNDPTDSERPHSINLVRLVTFIPGEILHSVPYTADLFYSAGKYVAKLDKILSAWSHPALTNYQTLWDLANAPKLADFVYAVRDDSDKEVVKNVLQAFNDNVVPNYQNFRKGVIHGDYNEQNILVEKIPGSQGKDHQVCGVIDFADATESYHVFEVAITIMYMSVESKIVDPLDVGGHVLAGYTSELSLNDVEFDCLKECVAARYCQSLVMGEYTHMQDPSNEYVLVTAKHGWPQLRKLWATPKNLIYRRWKEIIEGYQTGQKQS